METTDLSRSQYGSLKKIVGWVERSETQQSHGSVGFRSLNATCFSQGETLRVACFPVGVQVGKPQGRSGSPTYAEVEF